MCAFICYGWLCCGELARLWPYLFPFVCCLCFCMCGVSLQVGGEWWPWLISGVVQKVVGVGVGEIVDARD